MQNLRDYLDKFKNIIVGSKFEKDAIISIIRDTTKIQLKDTDFDIKNFTIRLTTSPAVKGEIFMRKQKILESLKAALGTKAPTDIR